MSETAENILSVDVSKLLNGKETGMDFALDWNDIPDFFGNITPSLPVKVSGSIRVKHGYAELSLDVEMDYEAECSRCLKELHKSVSLHTEKTVMTNGSLEEDNDDYLVVEGSQLRLDEACEELLFLELPSRELCSEDCKGLCPTCGADLNEGKCSCKKEIDPRMEIFRKYLTEEKDD